jgi:hypothetical protein
MRPFVRALVPKVIALGLSKIEPKYPKLRVWSGAAPSKSFQCPQLVSWSARLAHGPRSESARWMASPIRSGEGRGV